LFVTLDPLIRQVRLPDRRQLLISDTVGFIERLPHTLVAAFRATLEEVINADLLLHVVDAASADAGRHVEAVRGVLREVGADAVPAIEVYNKIDLLDAAELAALRQRAPEALFISARDGRGRDALIARLTQQLTLETRRVTFEFDAASDADRAQIRALYRQARVLRHEAVDGRVAIEADVPRRVLDRWLTTTATGVGS
jgi:GTP-binding protein HflX